MTSSLSSQRVKAPFGGSLTVENAGASAPLGATVTGAGVNFSVFSKRATGVDLLLFDQVDAAKPTRVVHLDPSPTGRITTGTYSFPD